MAKPARSPVLGYNHNVRYRGRIFHVQTEDSGPVNPRIFTHLYFGGTILATKKHEYDAAAAEETVRALMQSQHKAILKELKGARHDERIKSFFAARGEPFEVEPKRITGDGPALDLDAAPTDGRIHPLMETTPTPVPVTMPPAPIARPAPAAPATMGPSVGAPASNATARPAHIMGGSAAPAAPGPPRTSMPGARPTAPIFADTFEDEPTTPDHPADMSALVGRDRERPKETDGTGRAPLRAPLVPGWDPPVRDARAAVPPVLPVEPMIPGSTQPNRKRAPRVTPAMGANVVVSRTVPVGGAEPGVLRPGPRARRPGQSIPYVVKEGSHPLANPQHEVVTSGDLQTPLPPAVPLTPSPVTPANAPVTSQTTAPAAAEPVEKSLDEVILAYLAQGDGVEP